MVVGYDSNKSSKRVQTNLILTNYIHVTPNPYIKEHLAPTSGIWRQLVIVGFLEVGRRFLRILEEFPRHGWYFWLSFQKTGMSTG